MRYIDSGSRDAAEVLGTWLQAELTNDVTELRWQSGFFSGDALGVFAPTLERLRAEGGLTRVLVGSNEPGTLGDDVRSLATLMGLPRARGDLGVVSYDDGYFHPKTYHLLRRDGSRAAYIGSANLTGSGVSGLHVEAGVLLDTRSGDPGEILDKVASSIDDWFADPPRDGFERVSDLSDIDRLVEEAVLIAVRPPRTPSARTPSDAVTPAPSRPRLRRLFTIPPLPRPAPVPTPPVPVVPPPAPIPAQQSLNQAGFPTNVYFAPTPIGPTTGASAITGTPLPNGAVGLVVRLSRDDMRIFAGGVGTANLSLPVESMPTLRFGILGRGQYQNRPRAEFDMQVRYVGANNVIVMPDEAETNIMLYGYLPGESGHQNRRMLLPAALRALSPLVTQAGLPMPAPDDYALLEWPTPADPDFRLSFLEQTSPVGVRAAQLFTAARQTGQLVGDGACWLPANVSPAW